MIFEQLDRENAAADEDDGCLRISMDAKNKVNIGDFARGGKTWAKLKACDHDFSGSFITPYGLYLPQLKMTRFYFTQSKATADFIIDTLVEFWECNKMNFKKVHTLVLNLDNGPECHSRRTQFIKRICEFSAHYNLTIKLAYYPPYHSKYNPIERVWGGLEQFWNGAILDSVETVLNYAHNLIWAGKRVLVTLFDEVYHTGQKLSKKEMDKHELALERFDDIIGKWFVTINPQKVRDIFLLNSD